MKLNKYHSVLYSMLLWSICGILVIIRTDI